MHILFVGYGKTSQRVAQYLFGAEHQISTISRSPKPADGATHLIQDIHQLDLSQLPAIDWVYVLLSPAQSDVGAYRHTYLDSIVPITQALSQHPVQRVIVVSSTRVYGENAGQPIDDQTQAQPADAQGQLLLDMEQTWQQMFPQRCSIIRPSGIYGNSVARMIKLAHNTQSYDRIHWSNRIHIEDLARFLAGLIHVEQPASSYIVSDGRPTALHETIQWFQRQLQLPELSLLGHVVSGKKIYATRMRDTGFQLQHQDCFQDYWALLQQTQSVTLKKNS